MMAEVGCAAEAGSPAVRRLVPGPGAILPGPGEADSRGKE